MDQYLNVLNRIMTDEGYEHPDRTGVGRRSIHGVNLRFKMSDGLPVVTTRKIHLKSIITELLWFISGSCDNKVLKDQGCNIWNKWEVKQSDLDDYCLKNTLTIDPTLQDKLFGSVGPIYGPAWRNWPDAYEFAPGIDQLANLISKLKSNPNSARHIISAWNPVTLADEELSPQENVISGRGALAPCHVLQHYFVKEKEDGKKYLSMLMYQRSADWPVGVPFNIAQYSILLHLVASVVDMVPDEFIYNVGDAHVYFDQKEGVLEQLSRSPMQLPKLIINKRDNIDDYVPNDIDIVNYESHPIIVYPVAE